MNKTKIVYFIINGERDFWNGHAWTSLQSEARVFTEDGAHELITRRFSRKRTKPMVVSVRFNIGLKMAAIARWEQRANAINKAF